MIIGLNDWAGAWAKDKNDYHLYQVVPGGERQRELSYRFGINLLMYALTGSYKSDQVHSKSILERLKKSNFYYGNKFTPAIFLSNNFFIYFNIFLIILALYFIFI